MGTKFEPIGLTPLDHIPAKVYIPYMLFFNSSDPSTALRTIQNGINKLIAEIPWLAGDIVIHSQPETRGYIHPPGSALHEVPMLAVKHFESDEDFHAHPTQEYIPIPFFVPASQQRPVLRFQANMFPTKVTLVMSFMHMALDGSGAGAVLQALSECCKAVAAELPESAQMPATQTISSSSVNLRNQVSSWPSKCQTRLDHSQELGPSAFDSNVSAEQWGAMESALISASATYRITISPEKVAHLKALCTKLLPQLHQLFDPSSPLSTNDIITAILSISIDRVLRPDQGENPDPTHVFMVVDLRSRVTPPLPETYVGNMIYTLWGHIPYSQDNSNDVLHLTQLALHIRTTITASMNETLAYSIAAAVTEKGNWCSIEGKPADIIVTSWRHLKIFALDFGPGLGHIEDFESGFAIIPGSCVVLPQRTREVHPVVPVPWEILVTLRAGDYEKLIRDPLLSQVLVDL